MSILNYTFVFVLDNKKLNEYRVSNITFFELMVTYMVFEAVDQNFI